MADHSDDDDGSKVYKCGHCGITSASINELKTHMLTSHLNEAGNIAAAAEGDVHEAVYAPISEGECSIDNIITNPGNKIQYYRSLLSWMDINVCFLTCIWEGTFKIDRDFWDYYDSTLHDIEAYDL